VKPELAFDRELSTSRLLALDFRPLPLEISEQVHWARLELLPSRGVVGLVGSIEGMATLATVKLRSSAEFFDGFLVLGRGKEAVRIVVIPAFNVAQAKLSLRVFLVTSPLAGLLLFDLERHVAPSELSH
jgi:hypothetical protein